MLTDPIILIPMENLLGDEEDIADIELKEIPREAAPFSTAALPEIFSLGGNKDRKDANKLSQ